MSIASPVKMIPVARPYVGAEEEVAVLQVLRSGWLSQGQRVAEFESRFAEYVGAKHAVAVSSCTTGLHLALLAAGIGAGDEVLCPSLSFIATANSIRYVGATPVFVDVDPSTCNMDPNILEAAITPRTRAILLVHQIGLPAALSEILEIGRRRNLVVIEDAACAIGSAYQERKIGMPHSFMACFSFHPRKILTTGEGGMLTTSDELVAARLRRLRQHAMTTSDLTRHQSKSVLTESYDEVGFNYRMTDVQAAIGLVQLGRLDGFLARRRAIALRYTEELQSVGWLTTPIEPAGLRHNYQSYMVRVAADAPMSRDEIMQRLLEQGVSTRRGIMSTHREPPYVDTRWNSSLTNSESITDQGLILPLFHAMTDQDQDQVINCIRSI